MNRLLLVRHGHAEASWSEATDPGLDALGHSQAEAVAARLVTTLEPMAVRSSPRARARETALPLAERWGVEVTVDDAFDEVPSPQLGPGAGGRAAWLRRALAGRWADLGDEVDRWRRGLVAASLALDADTVVFTHFVAINSLVAHATADDAVTVFAPANASVTELQVDPVAATVRVVALGAEAGTEVR